MAPLDRLLPHLGNRCVVPNWSVSSESGSVPNQVKELKENSLISARRGLSGLKTQARRYPSTSPQSVDPLPVASFHSNGRKGRDCTGPGTGSRGCHLVAQVRLFTYQSSWCFFENTKTYVYSFPSILVGEGRICNEKVSKIIQYPCVLRSDLTVLFEAKLHSQESNSKPLSSHWQSFLPYFRGTIPVEIHSKGWDFNPNS